MQTRSIDYSINNHAHFEKVIRGVNQMIQQGLKEITMIKKMKSINEVYYAIMQHFNFFVNYTNSSTTKCLSIENFFAMILRKDEELRKDIDKNLQNLHKFGFDKYCISDFVFHNLSNKITNKSSRLIKRVQEYYRRKYNIILEMTNYYICRHIVSFLYKDEWIVI